MTTFNQKLDSMKESLASLFKTRRSSRSAVKSSGRSASTSSAGSSSNSSNSAEVVRLCATTASNISTPQSVRRVLHITFDARRQSFDGIPAQWRPYFETEAALPEEETPNDDSGVSMVINPAGVLSDEPPPKPPKELLSLTYDRTSGKFVDFPPHWLERLQRNNLLEPEFQKNPGLLVSVFAMMDEELKAMSQEGFCLDKGMYSSSPTLGSDGEGCHYVYSIEADQSNSSSEQDLPGSDCGDFGRVGGGNRRPSLVLMRAVAVPRDDPRTVAS